MAVLVSDKSDKSDMSDKKELLLEVACNTMIALINQETYLLSRQITKLAEDFEQKGGFTERLYQIRSVKRLEDR
jgi:four helix bundle suffix protein